MARSGVSLYARAGPAAGRVYPLHDAAVTVVGCAPSNPVQLLGPQVSAYHCLLAPDGSGRGFLLVDVRSRGGTRVNGRAFQKGTVRVGDVIAVGPFQLELRQGAAAGRAPGPEERPARFELVPRGAGEPVPLVPGSAVVVGRGQIADVRVDDPRASRLHCLIVLDPTEEAGVPWVIDLHSRRRTFVGQRPVHRKHLRPGDVLTIGRTEFELRRIAPSRAAAAAPVREPRAAERPALTREDAYAQQVRAAQRRASWAEVARAPSLLHRLRRRLAIGAAALLPLALAAVFLAFSVFQPWYRAQATVQVHPLRPRPSDDPKAPPPDYATFFNTQLALAGSDAVLSRCLGDPAIQDLALGRRGGDRLGALRAALQVERVPGTQLLLVSVGGPEPDGLSALANAVVRAYLACLDESEDAPGRRRGQALESRRRALREEIEAKTAALAQLWAASAGEAAASASADALAITQKAIADVGAKRAGLAARLASVRAAQGAGNPEIPSARVEEAIGRHPAVRSLSDVRDELRSKLRAAKGGAREDGAESVRRQLESVESQLSACRAEARPEIIAQLRQEARDAQRKEADGLEAELAACAASEKILRAMLAEQVAQRGVAEGQAVGMRALEDDVALARKSLRAVEEGLRELDASSAASGFVSVASMATEPSAAGAYKVRRLVGSLLGVLVAAALAILMMLLTDHLDDRVGSPEDLRLPRGAELLGCVSQWGAGPGGEAGKPVLFHPEETAAFAAEDVRDLMVGVLYPADGRPAQTLLVTSAGRGEGKTSLAANLAPCLAALGKRVLVVDGDLRKPDLAATLGVESVPGLSDLLAGAAELQGACRGTAVPGLSILPGGSPRPGAPALLGTEGMRDTLVALRSSYDYVLLDGPPLVEPETRILASLADGAILVCRAGSSRRKGVHAAIAALRGLGARLLGVTLVGVPPE